MLSSYQPLLVGKYEAPNPMSNEPMSTFYWHNQPCQPGYANHNLRKPRPLTCSSLIASSCSLPAIWRVCSSSVASLFWSCASFVSSSFALLRQETESVFRESGSLLCAVAACHLAICDATERKHIGTWNVSLDIVQKSSTIGFEKRDR